MMAPSAGTRSPGRTSMRSPGYKAAAGIWVSSPLASSRCANSALMLARLPANSARLAPHRQIEVAADEQEEQQHDRRIEIGVGGVDRGLVHREAERKRHADRDRHVHVDVPRAQRPEARFERTAGRHRPQPAARSRRTASGTGRASPASCRRRCPPRPTPTAASRSSRRSRRRRGISAATWPCALSSASARSGANGWA